MKKHFLLFLFSLIVVSVFAQAKTDTLTNEKIITLAEIGIKSSDIINKIKNSKTNFGTNTDDLIYLSNKGVSGDVINEMINANSKTNKSASNTVQTNIEIKPTIIPDKETEITTKQNNELENKAPINELFMPQILAIVENPAIPSGQSNVNTTTDTSIMQLLKKQIEQNTAYLESTKKQQEAYAKQNMEFNEKIKQLTDVLEAQNNLIKLQTQKQESSSQQQQENNTKQNQTLVESVNKLGETLKTVKTEERTWIPKKIGFGLNVFETFRLNISEQSFEAIVLEKVPLGNAIVLPISSTKFRFEPELGHAQATTKDAHVSLGALGAGLFGMHQKGKTNIYVGIRIAFHWLDYNETTNKTTVTSSGISLSPTFGAEYAFAEHFTFGGEVSAMLYFKLKEETKINGIVQPNNSSNSSFNTTTTQTRLIVRFYF